MNSTKSTCSLPFAVRFVVKYSFDMVVHYIFAPQRHESVVKPAWKELISGLYGVRVEMDYDDGLKFQCVSERSDFG